MFERYGNHRGRNGHALVFFIFLLTVRRIRMIFSLKHSASQGKSSLKISARWGSPFGGDREHPNTQTDSLPYDSSKIIPCHHYKLLQSLKVIDHENPLFIQARQQI